MQYSGVHLREITISTYCALKLRKHKIFKKIFTYFKMDEG